MQTNLLGRKCRLNDEELKNLKGMGREYGYNRFEIVTVGIAEAAGEFSRGDLIQIRHADGPVGDLLTVTPESVQVEGAVEPPKSEVRWVKNNFGEVDASHATEIKARIDECNRQLIPK